MTRLGPEAFQGSTIQVARDLLGSRLVHRLGGQRLVGRIVEVEAYLAKGDAASHSRMGPTDRNASMFLGPGHAYVYRIYGIHLCFNVVTAPAGVGEAVLVRALEPLGGRAEMFRRRGAKIRDERLLAKGPGRLVQALGIQADHDGVDLTRGDLGIWAAEPSFKAPRVRASARIGIGERSANLPLRFSYSDSPWVSHPPRGPATEAKE